jgi:hypothetical protein
MKAIFNFLLVSVAVTAIAGCGRSTDLSGNCSSEFVSDYNAARYGGAGYCDTFFSRHSDVTCTAKNLSSGSTTTANANDLKTVCGR